MNATAALADGGPDASSQLCGHEGEPPCPLEAWMKDVAVSAVRQGDGEALGAAFDAIVGFAPADGYPSWRSIAEDGARVAREGHMEAARAACRSCHIQYEAAYRRDLRGRPL